MLLRSHQSEFRRLCRQRASPNLRQVVVACTPGGGKSLLPAIAAAELMPTVADRICWVVPRVALQQQGCDSFRSAIARQLLGRALEIGTEPGQGAGYVATYQAIAASPHQHRAAFERHRYILVLDEPHHAPEGSEWAAALAPLVARCSMLIQMSGTFQRHDMRPVAFLPYQQHQYGQSFSPQQATSPRYAATEYTRAQALAERAIIPLEVRWFDLSARWVEDGQQQELFSLAEASEVDARDGIHKALRSGAAESILTACYQDWLRYKQQVNPRSKLLVVSPSVARAREFKARLEGLGAQRVAIAVSAESTEAHRNIERFKQHGGDRPDVLVTVAMAYEGLDVPACTHIAALTQIRSAPWIEQMATRATRVDQAPDALPYERQAAYLYCPADVLMRQCIERIVEQQALAIAVIPSAPSDEPLEPLLEARPLAPAPPEISSLESEATLSGFSDLLGQALSAAEIEQLPALARVSGTPEELLRSLPVATIKNYFTNYGAALAAMRGFLAPVSLAACDAPAPEPELSSTALRREIAALAARLDRQNGWDAGTTNKMLRRKFAKPRASMSAKELEQVRRELLRSLGCPQSHSAGDC